MLLERVSITAAARGDIRARSWPSGAPWSSPAASCSAASSTTRCVRCSIFSRKLGEALARGGQLNDADGVLREALDVVGPSGTTGPRCSGRWRMSPTGAKGGKTRAAT